MRVVADETDGTITFENCHHPRRFWSTRSDAVYTCLLGELRAVHLDRWVVNEYRHGRNATISTPDGKAVFSEDEKVLAKALGRRVAHISLNLGA